MSDDIVQAVRDELATNADAYADVMLQAIATSPQMRHLLTEVVDEAVGKRLRDVYRTLYADSIPDLRLLETLASVQRDNGRIQTLPIATRHYIDQMTAWRRLKDWEHAGWVTAIKARSGRGQKVIGWKLTPQARFALALKNEIA